MNGSITAVFGSGTTSMSELWISNQPLMDEPSKPRPSSKIPSFSSCSGTAKWRQRPMKSMKRRLTICAPCSFAYESTSFAVL